MVKSGGWEVCCGETNYSTSARTACSCGLHIYTCQNQHYPFSQLSLEGFTVHFMYESSFILHISITGPNPVPHTTRLVSSKDEISPKRTKNVPKAIHSCALSAISRTIKLTFLFFCSLRLFRPDKDSQVRQPQFSGTP